MSNLFDLSNKTALVVGASSGLGERASVTLSQAGARVILASRRLEKLESIASQLDNARAISLDVTDKASVQAAFNQLEADKESIDIVLCAAGIAGRTPIFDQDVDNDLFEKKIQTNLVGTWYIIRYAAHHMKNHNLKGSIITISSINGDIKVRAGSSAYGTSKAGVIQLTHILTEELAAANIRINCIVPGLFHTAMTDYRLHTPEMKQALASTIPVNFVAEPKDLDATVLYLASNRASRYVTGSCLTIDGGESWIRHNKIDDKNWPSAK